MSRLADEKAAGISFDLEFDLGKIKKSISDITEKVNSKLTNAFGKTAKNCESSCDSMSQSFKDASTDISKSMSGIDEKIKRILENGERSMKSKASSIAWIYRKQGMSQSDAMKKAWSDIDRVTAKGTNSVKKRIGGIGQKSKDTANNMESSFKGCFNKIALFSAAAFGVKKLIDFGKSCLSLGSDLQEVQNVVDVTFPSMSKQIDKFAQSAASKFGLSETMAKKFSGTFGSMAEAFGFSEKEAYKMSTALTGLAGDVASFYNISQDEAYTKLKSVFSGETETLKELGIVMTQSALDSYALANGYGKVTSKMTEAEKVSLRFAFVQSQLSNAAGDFARTSNSWANQTRILSLQFDSLKASIGQGLINAFTPVIKVINTVMAKLQTLANAFKNLTENVFGNAGSSSSTEKAATATSNAMNTASNASGTVAKNTKKAAKEAKKMQASVMGFDKLNKLDSQDTSDAGSGSSGSGAGGNNLGIKANVDTKDIDKASGKLEKLKKAFGALKNQFVKGFKIGLGDTSVLDSIKGNLASIKNSILEIVSSKEVQASFGNLLLTIAESAGKIAGSFASIALTITDNLTGGIAKYLAKDKDRIKGYLVRMFDIRAEIWRLSADFSVAIADIFTVFRSDKAKQVTADIIKIYADAFMGITEICARINLDLLNLITQPIIQNKNSIKEALTETLKTIQNVTSAKASFVENTFDSFLGAYEKYVSPAFHNIADGFSTIFSSCLDGYKKYLAPVLNRISKRFSVLVKQYINPLVESFMGLVGRIVEAVSAIYKTLSPFVGWFAKGFIAVIAEKLQWLWTIVEVAVSLVATILKGLFGVLNGLLDFIVGVFTLDWEKAWTGIKEIFGSVFDMIKNIAKTAMNFIKNIIATVLTKITNVIKSALDGIKLLFSKVFGNIKGTCTAFCSFVKGAFKTDFTKGIGAIGNVMIAFKKSVYDIWNGIKTIFKGINTFISGAFSGNWKKAWGGVKTIFKGIFNSLVAIAKTPLNLIIGLINSMISGIFKGINLVIGQVNKLSFKVPDWVKGIGGKKFGFDLKPINTGASKIPYLANGGYVEANTPQLAMIGDNKHQGEVVAPEDKLQAMVDSAVAQNTDAIISALREIFKGNSGGDIELTVNIGNKKLMREVLKAANSGNKRIGKTVYNV